LNGIEKTEEKKIQFFNFKGGLDRFSSSTVYKKVKIKNQNKKEKKKKFYHKHVLKLGLEDEDSKEYQVKF